ncbi:MAG: hypothetical protein IH996_09665 [Proteobacteria bacterium]|nr:hypothetical protein [Pseudomonadota bacterium]
MPEPTVLKIETAKKSKEGLNLEVHVLAELMPGPGLVKRCYVKPNVPGFGAFEIYCDEGLSIGGADTAPAPLFYPPLLVIRILALEGSSSIFWRSR